VQGSIHALTSSTIFFAAFAPCCTLVLGRDFLPILATSSVLLTVVGLAIRALILDSISGIALNLEERH
jgi:potassium-dependent mechanosensitive channel